MFELPPRMTKRIGLILLSVFFMGAGINHFVHFDIYVAIMPPYLPAHLELVYLSGLLEILGGLGVVLSPTRQLGWLWSYRFTDCSVSCQSLYGDESRQIRRYRIGLVPVCTIASAIAFNLVDILGHRQ